MDPIETNITGIFATLDRWQVYLSIRWKKNTNRRTLILLIIFGCAFAYIYLNAYRPPENFPVQKLITVPAGLSVRGISEVLEKDGVVRSALMFRVMTTLLGHEHDLRAGDYVFKKPQDVFHVARIVGIGAFGLEPIKITIPEGIDASEMAPIFAAQLEHFDSENFLAKSKSLEGFLFPDTYFFLPNATESTVIEAMRQDFDLHIINLEPQIEAFGRPLEDDVIMASIVEHEANNLEDRRMVAGVLWNRIARGMPLQSDVTLIYVLKKYDSQLTFADLKDSTPYNTYTHKGLPPGPIDSPGLSSILAAITPTKSKNLFYMADRSGVTHYCETFACQLANEQAYLSK